MHGCVLQSEEEGLKVKQEETDETVQLPDQAGPATAEASTSLVVPVQNGEGDSLNLSAGFIQVHMLLKLRPCLLIAMLENTLLSVSVGWDLHVFRPWLIAHSACVLALICVDICGMSMSSEAR